MVSRGTSVGGIPSVHRVGEEGGGGPSGGWDGWCVVTRRRGPNTMPEHCNMSEARPIPEHELDAVLVLLRPVVERELRVGRDDRDLAQVAHDLGAAGQRGQRLQRGRALTTS